MICFLVAHKRKFIFFYHQTRPAITVVYSELHQTISVLIAGSWATWENMLAKFLWMWLHLLKCSEQKWCVSRQWALLFRMTRESVLISIIDKELFVLKREIPLLYLLLSILDSKNFSSHLFNSFTPMPLNFQYVLSLFFLYAEQNLFTDL